MTSLPTVDLGAAGRAGTDRSDAAVTSGSSAATGSTGVCNRSPLATFVDCPHCGGDMAPEHAHYRCSRCGWRDSCCD